MSEAKLLVKLLGVFAADAAADSLSLDVDGHLPVHELIARVREEQPALAARLPDMDDPDAHLSVMVIVNNNIGTRDTMVGPEDQVTIVSPFGGG